MDIETYDGFYGQLESSDRLHGDGHGFIGRSMLQWISPNGPISWMHHANIDRLWVMWQEKRRKTWEDANPGGTYQYKDHYFIDDPANPIPYGHALTDAMWSWDEGESMPAVYDPSSTLSERTLLKGTGVPSRASVSTKIG